MRFISKYRGFSFVARPTRSGTDAWGQPIKIQEGIICDFRGGSLELWEVQQALATFQFAAPGHDEEITLRLSLFDTDLAAEAYGWDENTKAQVEARMQAKAGVDFIQLIRPPLPAPWPNYDKVTPRGDLHLYEVIVAVVEETGLDPAEVIAYERENLNRPDVIEALEALVPAEEEAPAEPQEINA
jgi:hypothetical protein